MSKENQTGGLDMLVMMLAASMTTEEIIEELKDAIEEYEKDPSENNSKKLTSICALVNTKALINDRGGKIEDAVNLSAEFKEMRSKLDFFEPNKN